MKRTHCLAVVGTLIVLCVACLEWSVGESGKTTRISDPKQHHRVGAKSYPYRTKSDYILKEMDLKPGDVVVDIGAGDGLWTEKMAKSVGPKGVVHAAEVTAKKVDQMKKKFAKTPQIKPYVCKTDGTGLPADSCDLAFLSQTYHHLPKNGKVAYLKHLSTVIKPTGRVVIIEKYTEEALGSGVHGTPMSRLVREVEEAGCWVPVRLELMTGTYHYIAILAQKSLFPPEPKRKPRKPKSATSKPAKSKKAPVPSASGTTGRDA